MNSVLWLAFCFFVTALLYACVGFGGGSTYTALLVLAHTEYLLIPPLSLLCNIIVVTGGTYHFYKAGHIEWARIVPLFALSIPAAWLGGFVPISQTLFVLFLGLALCAAGLHLLLSKDAQLTQGHFQNRLRPTFAFGIGGGLGFLSGLVGIGGGIFLAPILYWARWGTAKTIAGTCSVFILVNSFAGLIGQSMKTGPGNLLSSASAYWPIFVAVIIGGTIGSRLGSTALPPLLIRRFTAILILSVALRLLLTSWPF